MFCGLGFLVMCLGYTIRGLEFMVNGLGYMFYNFYVLELKVLGFRFRFGVCAFGFRFYYFTF